MSLEKGTSAEEEVALTADLATAEVESDIMSVEDLDPKPKKKSKKKAKEAESEPETTDEGKQEEEDEKVEEPRMGSPDWSDFVMRHFVDGELDPDGRPLVAGLRRVARLLLGPILKSKAKVVKAPSIMESLEKFGILQPTCVEYTVQFLMVRDAPKQLGAYKATFVDAADVYYGNTDPDYARHASATAATKAEGRCLRKALMLKGIASEEKTLVLPAEAALDGKITPNQLNFLNVLCKRNNINAMKFINMGKKQYANAYEVEAGVAMKMVSYLAETLDNTGNIPEALVGYDPKWLS